MPNWCNYEMKIKGSKNAIKRVERCLEAKYDYSSGKKPRSKHFFRTFETTEIVEPHLNEDGTYTAYLMGECAWSVYTCMCSGEHTYHDDCKKTYPNIFNGTTLKEQSKDCEIEVYSEEEGCAFSEHLLYREGTCLLDDCVEIEVNYDEDEEETEIKNPHRMKSGEYRWVIK